jgi:hypothetical protein
MKYVQKIFSLAWPRGNFAFFLLSKSFRVEDLESHSSPISRDMILSVIFGQLDRLLIESECEIVLENAQLSLVSDFSELSLSCLYWMLSTFGSSGSLITDEKLRLYVLTLSLELLSTNIGESPVPPRMYPRDRNSMMKEIRHFYSFMLLFAASWIHSSTGRTLCANC